MEHDPPKARAEKPANQSRDERRKAALKANMARRKAQAKARAGCGDAGGRDLPGDDNDKNT